MNKTKELSELIKKYPDHELIFMYPNEGSDYYYTLGYPAKIVVDEYWTDDEKTWFKSKDEDVMFDHYADNVFDDLFPDIMSTNEEQDMIIKKETQEFLNNVEWKKCICVFIHY